MSYPNITDENFNTKLTTTFDKYKINSRRKSYDQICNPSEYQLQIPQKFMSEYINPKTEYKTVLIFHRIGAGKTCTAISIAEKWKKYRQILIVLPASLKNNFRDEIMSKCTKNAYVTEHERELLNTYHPASLEYKQLINQINEKIDKYYNIYSYNKFLKLVEGNKIDLKKSILIIDEVQNIVSVDG